jgi:hypothetical protein
VDARFGLFGDNSNLDAPNVSDAQKSFWTHPMKVLGDGAQVESHFQSVWRVLVSLQARCTVCAKRTIGLENRYGRTQWYS